VEATIQTMRAGTRQGTHRCTRRAADHHAHWGRPELGYLLNAEGDSSPDCEGDARPVERVGRRRSGVRFLRAQGYDVPVERSVIPIL